MEVKSIRTGSDARLSYQGHKREAHELWQQMAGRWERGRDVLWKTTRPVSEWLVERLEPEPGQTVLELAAGAGETGFLAAGRLGHRGRLISSDFASRMVEGAERVGQELGVANAEFRVLDAERLDLDDDTVDGVICRFGYMLMPDPGRALRETRRVLRDQGRLVLSVFAGPEHNPWMTVARGAMVARGQMSPPAADEPGMFSLADPDRIRTLLSEAGFAHSEVEAMDIEFRFDDADALWSYTSELQGPIALAIAELDEAERRAVRAGIERGFRDFREDSGYRLPGRVLNVAAS